MKIIVINLDQVYERKTQKIQCWAQGEGSFGGYTLERYFKRAVGSFWSKPNNNLLLEEGVLENASQAFGGAKEPGEKGGSYREAHCADRVAQGGEWLFKKISKRTGL